MRRIPLRWRLVAGFSAAMLVVLAGAAVFVYWRVEYALDRALGGDLDRASAALASTLGPHGIPTDDQAVAATGAVYQVLDAQGAVMSHSATAGTDPLIAPSRLPADGADPVDLDVGRLLPISDRPLRLRITPTVVDGEPAYLVVGVRRDHRDEALRELVAQLAIAVAGALLVTAAVGYLLARSALAPVERYRRQAESIAGGASGVRLDVPANREDEVTRLGDTLNDMLAALERAVATERRFVDDASHELRTPMTLIKGRVQAAQRHPRSVEEHEVVLAELLVDVERLTRLAAQLLELRTAEMQPDSSDAAAVAERVARRHDVDAFVPARPVVAEVPEDVIERIIENLVGNALVHGGPPVAVTVAVRDSWVEIVVTDAGDGMDAALLDRATDRFARADDARARPGSGLGLAIVRSLTESAGGQLRLCSHGEHRRFGAAVDLACCHDPGLMTASVLFASAPRSPM